MRPLKFVAVLVCCLLSSVAAGQGGDDPVAARVFGPQWQAMARRAGIIFSGTVLKVERSRGVDTSVATVQMTFRVDRAVAGTQAGEKLVIREWMGAWSMHPPIRRGQRLLLLLYPPSRAGLTSPVRGSLGLVPLDGAGQHVSVVFQRIRSAITATPQASTVDVSTRTISAVQLELALRNAREQ